MIDDEENEENEENEEIWEEEGRGGGCSQGMRKGDQRLTKIAPWF